MSEDTKTCPVCDKKFTRKQINIRPSQWPGRKFCSWECTKVGKAQRTKKLRDPAAATPADTITCKRCGKKVTRQEKGMTKLAWMGRMYCSMECSRKDRSQRQWGYYG